MTGTVLIVSHFYPPGEMVAARRPAALAKWLERLGYRVLVLTSAAWGSGPAPGRVWRTRDLMGSRLNWRGGNLRAWTGQGEEADYDPSPSLLARLVVPDVALATWVPFALGAAGRIAAGERIDCVLTTSGPESGHLVGLALRRRGAAWIADFRDGWGFESIHSWPTGLQRQLDAGLERLVVRRADAVTAVTEPIAADLRGRFGTDALTLTNGFDPDEAPPDAPRDELLSEDRLSLVHTGRMASSHRSPQPLVEALRLLDARSPELAREIELVFAGPLTPAERGLLEALGDRAVLPGSVPHRRSLRLQRQADGLVLLTAGSRRGEATGKLFEYLQATRPVLVLGERTEAARIVEDAGAGAAVPVDDPTAIAAGLERLARGELAPSGDSARREAFAYPALARRLAEVVEAARERRKSSP
jgi:glycosyltransferase involved in cell wall biosynthesis